MGRSFCILVSFGEHKPVLTAAAVRTNRHFISFADEEEITFPPTYRFERDTREKYAYTKAKATGVSCVRSGVGSWFESCLSCMSGGDSYFTTWENVSFGSLALKFTSLYDFWRVQYMNYVAGNYTTPVHHTHNESKQPCIFLQCIFNKTDTFNVNPVLPADQVQLAFMVRSRPVEDLPSGSCRLPNIW